MPIADLGEMRRFKEVQQHLIEQIKSGTGRGESVDAYVEALDGVRADHRGYLDGRRKASFEDMRTRVVFFDGLRAISWPPEEEEDSNPSACFMTGLSATSSLSPRGWVVTFHNLGDDYTI